MDLLQVTIGADRLIQNRLEGMTPCQSLLVIAQLVKLETARHLILPARPRRHNAKPPDLRETILTDGKARRRILKTAAMTTTEARPTLRQLMLVQRDILEMIVALVAPGLKKGVP